MSKYISKKTTVKAGVAVGAIALLAASALPASAAQGDTATTFALAGGTLSVAVVATATLTGGVSGATSVSGQLGSVTVTDARGVKTPWSAKATSTVFTDGATPATSSTGISYDPGTITKTGSATVTGTIANLSTTAATVAAPSVQNGNNTATWNPTLTVALPASSLAGTYSGLVNTSVV